MENKVSLRKSLFWDTHFDDLDEKKHAIYIIERVLHRGTWEEFRYILNLYGRTKISNTVKNLRYMDKRVMCFCSVYFEIPLNEIRCYKLKQSNNLHWNY